MIGRLRGGLPKSKLGWVLVLTTVAAWLIIFWMIGLVLAPTMENPNALGSHDWDQMEAHRYLVTKTILRFHQFPFWNPYACGGHTAWGGFESDTIVVSPWLPFYLAMSLPHAMRIEILGSALISAAGAWLLAGRFTRSPAARAFVVAAFAVDGRWALQIAAGHTWHLSYAWTPWVLYFFDRAVGADRTLGQPRRRDVVLAGVCFAAMVYTGGIYPFPQTAVGVAAYAVFLAAATRSFRPIVIGLAVGLLGVCFAAPKALPVLDVLQRFPRLVDSPESLDLASLVQMLTSHDQDLGSHPANVSPWGWHEWGIYVGWPVVVITTLGCLLARGVREGPLRWAGLLLGALGFGTFDPLAPWPLLRHLPVFQSQHVPSRWLYPALLLLLVVAASTLERILKRSGALRGWLEVALVAAVAWVAHDIAKVSRQPLSHAFVTPTPSVAESQGAFRTEIHLPSELAYVANWAPSSLSAEMANIGTIDCYTFPAFYVFSRDRNGRTTGLGARGRGDPAFKGETFIADGVGEAQIVAFTPNAVTVRVRDAQAGEHVVLNQNWDPGWSADGSAALNWADTAASQLHGAEATVVFRYTPRFWYLGLFVFAATVAAVAFAYRAARRRRAGTAISPS